MSRFFLHIRQGQKLILDPEGSELPNFAAAHCEALTSMRLLVVEHLLSSHSSKAPDVQQIEVADEAGQVLATVRVQDALRPFR